MNESNIIDIEDERNRGTAARGALRDAVKATSAARSWADAQLEWDISGSPDIDKARRGVCACGQAGLMYLYKIVNRVTGAELHPIGSTCIVEHFGSAPEMMARLAALRAVAGATVAMREHGGFLDLKRDLPPTRIKALAAEGVLGTREAALRYPDRSRGGRARQPSIHATHLVGHCGGRAGFRTRSVGLRYRAGHRPARRAHRVHQRSAWRRRGDRGRGSARSDREVEHQVPIEAGAPHPAVAEGNRGERTADGGREDLAGESNDAKIAFLHLVRPTPRQLLHELVGRCLCCLLRAHGLTLSSCTGRITAGNDSTSASGSAGPTCRVRRFA